MSDERPRIIIPPVVSHGALAILSIALGALLFDAVQERRLANQSSAGANAAVALGSSI